MDTRVIVKKEKTILLVNLILGIVLLAAGIFINSFVYHKVLVGISFIPLSLAVASLIKIFSVNKNPSALVEEYDERISAAKNRADAKSLGIIRYTLFLVFMAYSLIKPQEIFESLTWWMILVISMLTILLPSIILGNINKNYRPDN